MDYVFISHVEEDGNAALEIAVLLESHGYATWTYEVDCLPGQSYLVQTFSAIAACRVFLLVVSRKALRSPQLPKEIVQAHEAGKKFVPVLRDLTDAELKAEDYEWRMAIGAATSVTYEADDPSDLGEQLASGLGLLGVTPRPRRDDARVDALRRRRARIQSGSAPARETEAAAPSPVRMVEASPVRPSREVPRRTWWLVGALAMLLVVVAAGWWTIREDAHVVLGVMDIKRHGQVKEWMSDFTRDGLNSVLNDLGKVPVFSKQKIDFIRTKRGLSEIEAAEELGITRMISGTLSAAATKLILQLQVIDIARNGMLLATAQVRGSEEQLLEMQNEAAFELLRRLQITVTDEERRRLVAARSNDLQDYYELLANTMGDLAPGEPGAPAPGPPRIPPGAWDVLAPRAANALEGPEEPAVRALLDRYRTALQDKDVDGIGNLYVTLSDSMRSALTQYFRNASDLTVEFSDYDILVEGDEALATFTRVDMFKDVASGREVRLQVQVNSIVAKQNDGWRIKLFKR